MMKVNSFQNVYCVAYKSIAYKNKCVYLWTKKLNYTPKTLKCAISLVLTTLKYRICKTLTLLMVFYVQIGEKTNQCPGAAIHRYSLKQRKIQHRCFSVNFLTFLRTHFYQNTEGLLLSVPIVKQKQPLERFCQKRYS